MKRILSTRLFSSTNTYTQREKKGLQENKTKARRIDVFCSQFLCQIKRKFETYILDFSFRVPLQLSNRFKCIDANQWRKTRKNQLVQAYGNTSFLFQILFWLHAHWCGIELTPAHKLNDNDKRLVEAYQKLFKLCVRFFLSIQFVLIFEFLVFKKKRKTLRAQKIIYIRMRRCRIRLGTSSWHADKMGKRSFEMQASIC